MHPFALFFHALLLLGASRFAKATVTQLYEYPQYTFIENIHVRENGRLLLSTLQSGELFTLDPAAASPSPIFVANLTGSTALTGMATIAPGLFAVSGGVHSRFIFANNSMAVYVVRLPSDSDTGTVLERISVPGTQMLNGMAALPGKPYVLLSADSIGGRIFRINAYTREVSVAFADPALGPGPAVPLGANGLKIFDNFLYWTNSGRGTFARVKIDDNGNKVGNIQVVATLPGDPSMTNAYDDFDFDSQGNAYVALHSYAVMKIAPDGTQTLFAGGTDSTSTFKEPTSAALSLDGKSVYIATGGTTAGGTLYGGQVINVTF